jgi:hypothetical protein
MTPIVRRAPIGWNEDDFDVVADGVLVGRIFVTLIAPEGRPWMWTTHAHARLRGDARSRDGGVR